MPRESLAENLGNIIILHTPSLLIYLGIPVGILRRRKEIISGHPMRIQRTYSEITTNILSTPFQKPWGFLQDCMEHPARILQGYCKNGQDTISEFVGNSIRYLRKSYQFFGIPSGDSRAS